MNATRLTCGLLALLLTSGVGRAQDDDEDTEREVDAELAESERELKFAREHVEFLAHRIERLRKLRMTRMSVVRAKQAMKRADADGNDQLVEELEDRVHELELDIELSWTLVELIDELWRVREVRAEMPRVDPLFGATERLLVLQRGRIELAEKLFRVYREGPEADEGPLQDRAERLTGVFELRFSHLELSREIEWARDEGEDDAVEELESELKEVLRELRDLDEEPDVTDGRADSVRAIQLDKTAGPVMLSDAQIAAAGNLDFARDIVPLLESACFECHDQESTSGDLNLQQLVSRQPLVVNRSHWINVIAQLRNRSMPPADEPQPDEASRRRLVAFLSNAIHNFDYTTVRQPGFESARRLTHEEYNNTVRDLFGVDLRPADNFPVDLTASSGFDNSANSLFIQPITMERYVGAAEDIIRRALPEKRTTREHDRVHQRIFGNIDHADPFRVVARFSARAWRRLVTPQDMQGLMGYYRRQRDKGLDYEASVREVLQVILASPGFLIRTEADRDTDEPYYVDDHELASRLSYFLWASMPDDKLFGIAWKGQLHQPEVLDAQISRMLADARADSLGSQFAAQWLGFNDLGRVRPGPIDNPWCTDSLIAAMQDESAMFFTSLIRNDDPIERIVTADYTFLNQELARHYGMKNVTGSHMRRVSMQTNTRGGIFGQGSILAVTSFPGRTSPVIRGNWILSTLLGTPPPPPPPNVSEFDDRIADNRKLSQRQQFPVTANSLYL